VSSILILATPDRTRIGVIVRCRILRVEVAAVGVKVACCTTRRVRTPAIDVCTDVVQQTGSIVAVARSRLH